MIGPSYSGATLTVHGQILRKSAPPGGARKLLEEARLMRSFVSWSQDLRMAHVFADGPGWLEVEYIAGPGLAIGCPLWKAHVEAVVAHITGALHRPTTYQRCATNILVRLDATCSELPPVPIYLAARRAIREWFAREPRLPLVSGLCIHGDLTLCNMLCGCHVRPGLTVLVDPTVAYVRSPVLDVVKLRQDTVYGWLELHRPLWLDAERVGWVNALLERTFASAPWWEHVRHLDALNVLRVAMYAERMHDASVRGWCERHLERYVG